MTTTRERASVVCVERGALLCVRMRDPLTRTLRLFVPGGGIELGERAVETAEREALEETGYRVRADAESELVARYVYEWNGVPVDVTTHFFRAQLLAADAAPALVQDASYNEGVCWLPLAEIEQAMSFHAEILRAVSTLARRR